MELPSHSAVRKLALMEKENCGWMMGEVSVGEKDEKKT